MGSEWTEMDTTGYQDISSAPSPLYHIWNSIMIKGDIRSDLIQEHGDHVLEKMEREGLVACLPIEGPTGNLGVLLVGRKVKRVALDPIDLDFLQQFTERAGLFVENYLLSTYLLTQLEETSKVRKELEKSDRFKTDIITVTSHEFRTPLTIINGFALTLTDSYDRLGDEERKHYLSEIVKSCRRMDALLGQFMTVSYFQSGKARAESKPIQIGELFYEICSAFSPEQSSCIEKEISNDEVSVMADRHYLIMMLKNLVENAIRFSPPEKPVLLRAEEADEAIRISVQDQGKGIDPSDVHSVFYPFTRLEDTDKHQIGTGLGLYIVKSAAELLGTEVEIDSKPGRGTTVHFNLPCT